MFSPGAYLSLPDSSSIKCPDAYFSLLHTKANRASGHCYSRNRNPRTHTKPSPLMFRYVQRRPVQTWRDISYPDHPGEEIRNGRGPTCNPWEWGGTSIISVCLLSSYVWPRNETLPWICTQYIWWNGSWVGRGRGEMIGRRQGGTVLQEDWKLRPWLRIPFPTPGV